MENRPSISVVICAYTLDRWELMKQAVASAEAQNLPPVEIILCIDHNDKLLQQSEEYFLEHRAAGAIPLTVVANKYDGHLGSARNTGVEIAQGDIVAFLDDDAAATPDWLATLTAPYVDKQVGAVGGAPIPAFEEGTPPWFPREFYWVFGCAYRGMPTRRGPLAHLIGANMSARRAVLAEIGGFHSDNHDDMDMCHRIAHAKYQVIYEPAATVNHSVPAARTRWSYFWRRCFYVNRGKVEAFATMGEAASLGAEMSFVTKIAPTGILLNLGQVLRGDRYGLTRTAWMIAGIALAGLGNLDGQRRLRRSRGKA